MASALAVAIVAHGRKARAMTRRKAQWLRIGDALSSFLSFSD
jgi:hypothetical protein